MLENDLAPSVAANTIYLKDYQAPLFNIATVNMLFELHAEHTDVTTTLAMNKVGAHNDALVLDGEKFELVGVQLDDNVLEQNSFEVTDSTLRIQNLPAQFVLVIKTRLQPHLNTELSGLYQSSGNFCTQCEAEGFRRITYFLDRPDVLSVYTVTIVGDKSKNPVMLSNGNIHSQGKNENGTHWIKWHDPHPKSSYLFALVAGDLQFITDTFTTMSGKQVELNIYTQAHNIELCDHAMQSLKKSMRWDEEVYGREYDLDIYNIVAVDDFNMGAMENKGLNVFNSKYVLANQQTATDADYQGIESVIGHEYFHNWSGNRVTCRDWFQLSLKEGFTVFRDQEFSADMGSRGVKRIQDVRMLRTYQFKEDGGPMAHPVRPDSYQEINNFYTVTIYEKGAEVIRMMHSLVGVEGFRRATDLYFDTYDGQAVTTEDFVQCMEKANGIDLTQFRLWYTQSGTPVVQVTQDYASKTKKLSLTIKQYCPDTPGQTNKQPFQIPIDIALFDEAGKKLSVAESCNLNLTQAQQTFTFEGIETAPVVSFLRGFSAPIKVEFEQSPEDLLSLMAHDDDGFTQWEASQTLAMNLILGAIKNGTLDETLLGHLTQGLTSLLEQVLACGNSSEGSGENGNESIDKAIVAEMLILPSESYISEQLDEINPQKVCKVRASIVKRLAASLEPLLIKVYEQGVKQKGAQAEFSISAEAIAERSLKSSVLSYLVELNEEGYYQLAVDTYHQANNMTDRLSAFKALVFSGYSAKQDIIQHFYLDWKTQTLVLDKWFAIQAMTPNEDALTVVKALMNEQVFSINNPNKVRAVIGAFAGNMVGFHREDGQGYEFLADTILQLNDINPQIAARLMGTFNSWKKYAQPYSQNMKSQIERILAHDGLVKDIKEIASKALA